MDPVELTGAPSLMVLNVSVAFSIFSKLGLRRE